MRTTFKALGLVSVGAFLAGSLAACGGGQENQSGSGSGSEAGGKKSVVVYSNSVSEGRGDFLKEMAAEAGFDVQFVDLGGGDIQNRLLAEKANPVADVAFGLNTVYFEKLKAADVLESYVPSWEAEVQDQALDPDQMFWPIVNEPIMLVYNVDAYPNPEDAPQDWTDLWEKEEFHDKYETVASLGGATIQMVISGILTRYPDPDGKLGISDEGWEAIKEFFEYGNRAVEGTDLYARMADGEVNMGQMWLAGKIAREEQYGIKTEAVRPEVGVPMVTQGLALVKDAKHSDAAKEFIDWFGSAEPQAAWSKEFGTAPANKSAQNEGDQEVIEYTNSFTPQDIDWSFVAENIDSWVEEIELNYLP